jgi:heat shock protein HtpX
MENLFYNRHTVNILTVLLTAVFFLVPAMVLGISTAVLFALLALISSGFLFSSSVDPERIPGIRRLSPYYSGPLYRIVAELSERAGLETVPSLYISDQDIANAAAVETGRGPAVIVSNRLLDVLSYDELEGVLAHEISHIRNSDLRLLSMLGQFRAIYSAIPRLLLLLFLFSPLLFLFLPLAQGLIALGTTAVLAVVIERAIMRLREYAADYGAATLIDDPMSLARALERIENAPVYVSWFGRQVAVPRNRLERPEGFGALFRSHPRTRSRIRFLKNLARQQDSHPGVSWYSLD